jgi:large subunit ribosomal protein L4
MELQVTNLDGKAGGNVTLADEIFGLEPRADILHRMVRYQQLKAMSGTHDVKNRSEGAATGKKFKRQKGGGARHGDRKAPQFRGGGRAFGPTPRSHAIDLPKKVRALALRHALSAKAKAGELVILDSVATKLPKTAALLAQFGKLEWTNALIIDGAELDTNFALAARNIPNIDVLPIQGINVADILRRHKLVLTKAALEAIEARFASAEKVTA